MRTVPASNTNVSQPISYVAVFPNIGTHTATTQIKNGHQWQTTGVGDLLESSSM